MHFVRDKRLLTWRELLARSIHVQGLKAELKRICSQEEATGYMSQYIERRAENNEQKKRSTCRWSERNVAIQRAHLRKPYYIKKAHSHGYRSRGYLPCVGRVRGASGLVAVQLGLGFGRLKIRYWDVPTSLELRVRCKRPSFTRQKWLLRTNLEGRSRPSRPPTQRHLRSFQNLRQLLRNAGTKRSRS